MFMILTILFSAIIKGIRDILNSVRPKTVIFPPATSGKYFETTSIGYNFYLPPYKCASPGQTATKNRKADQIVFLDASVPDSFIKGNGTGS